MSTSTVYQVSERRGFHQLMSGLFTISLHFSMIFMFFDLKLALFSIFFCIFWHFFMHVFSKMPVGSLETLFWLFSVLLCYSLVEVRSKILVVPCGDISIKDVLYLTFIASKQKPEIPLGMFFMIFMIFASLAFFMIFSMFWITLACFSE